jgi:glycosyltransferase involved in cell wall biosynthesis
MADPTNPDHPRVLVLPSSIALADRTIGGGERYAAEYTRALAGFTHAEQALFSSHPEPSPTGGAPTRVLTWKLRPRGIFPPLTRAARAALAEYDVLHIMCFPNTIADGFLVSGLLQGQLVVLTDIGGGGRCVSGYLNHLSRRLNPYRLAHGLAHLSHYAAGLFAGWGNPTVILHGGARPLFAPDTGRFDGYALFVGRLLAHKGVLEVIHALPKGRELRVVGRPYDTAYFERLRQAAEGKRVTFITDADDTELARQYQGASVVLQPSLPTTGSRDDRSELLGLVAIEAQAAGKPVIVTRTTSLPELVEDGVTGRIVAPNDIAALHDALESFLGNPSYARQIGANALRLAATRFTWDSVARRGLEFYRSLAARRRAGA